MAKSEQTPVTVEELPVSSLAQTVAIAHLLVEKGLVTQKKILQKVSEHRAMYQRTLNPTRH